jgi:hypothetical protein
MVRDGLITMERVQIIAYRSRNEGSVPVDASDVDD